MRTKILYIILLVSISLCSYGQNQDIDKLRHNAEYYNDSWSQNKLGLAYENGEGVKKDPKIAFSWFEKAANNGYSYAYYNLGRHYRYGLSVSVDMNKALYWFEKAANAHHAHSSLLLGHWYQNGTNVSKDLKRAVAYYKDAAFGGLAAGKHQYAYCYAYGLGVRQDSVRALLWIDRAIKDNYYFSYFLKGIMYRDGVSVNKSPQKAFRSFLIGSVSDDASCQNSLAICYLEGFGVEKDTINAIKWFEKSANNGNLYGQRNLAYKYVYGVGVEQDINQAIYWFEKAAEHDDEDSYDALISLYYKTKNYTSLYRLVEKGSTLNFNSCLNTLAYCYAKGEGTAKDIKKAISTIDKAIALFPNDINLYDTKGEILSIKGDKKGAKSMWDKVNSLDPNFYSSNNSVLNQYILANFR